VRKIFAAVLLLTSFAAALERQPNADYRARREKLAAALNAAMKAETPNSIGGAAVLILGGTEPSTGNAIWGFHQTENFYYLSGWPEPDAALLIVSQREHRAASAGQPEVPAGSYTETLFLPARNPVQERWTGPKLGPDSSEAKDVTGFANVAALATLPQVLASLPFGTRLYTETPASALESPDATLGGLARLQSFPGGFTPRDVRPVLDELRKVKDAGEIALIRKAAAASEEAHLATLHAMKPGTTEREISALMQYEFERHGCERPAYAPIVGSGFNSTVLHYSANSGPVRDGDVVVMDVAGEYSFYAMDITRTLPANGKFTARQREIYDIVLGAQQAAIAAFQAGKSRLRGTGADSLNQLAIDYFKSHGKDVHGQPLDKYFIHGLGHFVGLDVHDPGDATKPLDKGMVFTLEPGLYIPDEKIGVRIEDTFLVGDDGKLQCLTCRIPKTPDEVEQAMKKP
jgi:Xaa-Pro aminopeptidase